MNSKRSILILAALILALFTAVVSSAQDSGPRALLPTALFENHSFEDGAQHWTVINATGDSVKCGDVTFPLLGACAVNLKGSAGENTVIKQTYKPSGIVDSGDQAVVLTAFLQPKQAGMKIKFFIKVKFNDGSPDIKASLTYTSAGANINWEDIVLITDPFDASKVRKVVAGAKHLSTSGRILLDSLQAGTTSN